ncbi:MAG: glycosyltransferase, partial [bacterium]
MRIGIDARFYGPIGGGGLGRYTKELVDNLEQIDRTNQYVIFLRRENWNDYNPKNPNFKKVLAPYKWYSWGEQLMMPWKIWREKVNLMHFPHFNAPLIYSLNFLPHFSAGWKDLSFMFRGAKAPQPELNRMSKKSFSVILNEPKRVKDPVVKQKNAGILRPPGARAQNDALFRQPVKLGRKTKNFVLTVHDLILMKFPSKKATTLAPIYFKFKFLAYRIIISAALRRAGKIIVPSQFVKDDILRYFKIPSEKIVVIYEGVTKVDKENGFGENRFVKNRIMNHELGIMNGKEGEEGHVEISNFKFETSKEGAENDLKKISVGKKQDKDFQMWYNKYKYIFYVGNAYPHKNLERLIEAFVMVFKEEEKEGKYGKEGKEGVEMAEKQLEIKKDLKLVFAGVNNYFYERLKGYAEDNFPDIKDRIIFFGYATDKELVELYKNAALYAFPSLQEGFGLPPLEAMSY